LQIFKLTEIESSKIRLDESNPNQMTTEQMNGLKESLKNFGYLQPVIIDQTNMIVDGEHRFLVMKDMGYERVPVYKIDVESEGQRKIIRQAMNKLRGKHDISKDIVELEQLLSYDADLMKNMLQVDEDFIKELREIEQHNSEYYKSLDPESSKLSVKGDYNQGYGEVDEGGRKADSNPVGRHAETYLHGNVKQLALIFNNEEFVEVMNKVKPIMEHANIKDHTDLFIKLVDTYHEYVLNKP
jgi:hypothetical protein